MAPAQRGWRHQALVPSFANEANCDAERPLSPTPHTQPDEPVTHFVSGFSARNAYLQAMRARAVIAGMLCVAIATSISYAGARGNGPDGSGPPGQAQQASPAPSQPDPPGPNTPLSPEGRVTSGADQNVARDAVDTGKALPLADIIRLVTTAPGSRVIDARLISNGRTLVYRLVMLSDSGVSRRIYVDARTGSQVPSR
jgi:hypothetical protein